MIDAGSSSGMYVVMLCGLPGSGKSTVAAELGLRLRDAEVIATDVIGGRGGRYRKLRQALAGLAGRRRFVILDGTFFARAVRDRVREMSYPTLLAYLRCPLEVCLERNRRRSGSIPEKGLLAMRRRFEEPVEDEGPVVIHSDRTGAAAAADRIERELLRRLRAATSGRGEEGA